MRISFSLGDMVAVMLTIGAFGFVVIGASAGCSRTTGMDLHRVSGVVTLDGEPIADGWITLRLAEGDTRGFAGKILEGRYTLESFAGIMRVEITAERAIPGKFVRGGGPTDPDVPVMEQYIPARYNQQSELRAEVPRGGNRGLDFSLTTTLSK